MTHICRRANDSTGVSIKKFNISIYQYKASGNFQTDVIIVACWDFQFQILPRIQIRKNDSDKKKCSYHAIKQKEIN